MQMVVTTRIWRDYRTFSRGWDQPLEGSIFTQEVKKENQTKNVVYSKY